jgi:hypothetical protein
MEKDFNLYVAEIARDYLENLGVNVIFLRDRDVAVNIFDRVEYFAHEPDIVVSVHANSMPLSADFSRGFGPLMFYTLDHSEQAADDMIRLIISEMVNFLGTDTLFTSLPDGASLPHRRQNFAMARYTGGPSMLFEMGFLCNPEEYELLLNIGYLDRMGEALGRAIAQWIVDGRTAQDSLTVDSRQWAVRAQAQAEIEPEGGEDALPAFAPAPVGAERTYRGGNSELPLKSYIILVASVFLCGVMLCLPSFFKSYLFRRKSSSQAHKAEPPSTR